MSASTELRPTLRARLRVAIGPREVQFYSGVALVAWGFGWGVAGAVLVLDVALAPLLARLGGRT